MSLWLFIFILGSGVMLISSMIAGLKDNVFAAQIALSMGMVFNMLAVGTLVYIALNMAGAF